MRAAALLFLLAGVFCLTARGAAQTDGSGSGPDAGGPFRLHLSGGLAHLEKGAGLSAGLGGAFLFRRLQASVTAIHGMWIPVEPEPGFRRLYSIMGSVICQDLDTREIVDRAHCDDTSGEVGAMAELGVLIREGPRSWVLGGGYRMGEGRGSFVSVRWGPGFQDPAGSWYIAGRFGSSFLEAVAGISFWPKRPREDEGVDRPRPSTRPRSGARHPGMP